MASGAGSVAGAADAVANANGEAAGGFARKGVGVPVLSEGAVPFRKGFGKRLGMLRKSNS
jgi:hypothetical protein